jgi:hypothetical protein
MDIEFSHATALRVKGVSPSPARLWDKSRRQSRLPRFEPVPLPIGATAALEVSVGQPVTVGKDHYGPNPKEANL